MQRGQAVGYLMQVAVGKVVVVGVSQLLLRGKVAGEVLLHGPRVGNAREQHHPALLGECIQVDFTGSSRLGKYRLQVAVVEGGEVEMLVGEEVQPPRNDVELDGLHVGGAFGHNHDIGPRQFVTRLPQATGRQQLVQMQRPVVVGEHNRDEGRNITVLEGIVEQNDVEVGQQLFQLLDAPAPVGIDGNGNVGEFPLDLVRLVADVTGGRLRIGQDEPPALALVAPAEHGHPVFGLQQFNQVFDVRGLAGTAYRQITHRDDRNVELFGREYAPVEESVPDSRGKAV